MVIAFFLICLDLSSESCRAELKADRLFLDDYSCRLYVTGVERTFRERGSYISGECAVIGESV